MCAAQRETGCADGAHHPEDSGHEFPQHSLLFDDERILRKRA